MTRSYIALFLFVALLALSSAPRAALAAERRVALVIGNGVYRHATPLPNPRNDASAVAETLRGLGFEVIDGYDLTFRETGRVVARFADLAASAEVALLYYAGHGIQVAGRNYLIPIDSELSSPASLSFEAVALDGVLASMNRAKSINLIFLDACRNNPMPKRSAGANSRRAADFASGLARLDVSSDAFVAFATDPDATAADGLGRHSPFTAALLKHIAAPDIDVEIMMKRVMKDVRDETKGRQRPWISSSLTRPFMFNPKSPAVAGYVSTAPMPRPAESVPPRQSARCDGQFLDAMQQRDRVKSLSEFLEACPGHAKAGDAARLQEQALDSRNCDRALTDRSIAALRDYLDAHPKGRCAGEVQTELDRVIGKQQQATEAERREAEAQRQEDERRAREEDLRRKEREVAEREQRQREEAIERRRQELASREAALQQQEQTRTWSPPGQAATPPPTLTGPSLWNHNGSTMKLTADGARRQFYYERPRQGMRDEGVSAGTLLFEGTRNGDAYSGTAFVFSRVCGRLAYRVSGAASSDNRSITLHGQAPRLGSGCRVIGYRADELTFQFLGD